MKYLTFTSAAMALALAAAAPASAAGGSPGFAVSLYQCSEVILGGENAGDNCIVRPTPEETYEARLEDVESTIEDPENGDD